MAWSMRGVRMADMPGALANSTRPILVDSMRASGFGYDPGPLTLVEEADIYCGGL